MVQMDAILKGGMKAAQYVWKGSIKHLPTLLTGFGTAGVIGGVFLAVKKAPDAKVELDQAKAEWEALDDKEKRVKADYIFKRVRIGAKHFWVVGLVVGGSLVCFWIANHVSLKRLTSALTAAGISAKAKEELEQKIRELDGDKKLQKIRDEIDGDRIRENPPVEEDIIHTGFGNHLCYEPITGRYFYSNIEKIKRAVICCRDQLQKEGYLSLNDWFCMLGLDTTELHLCWTASSIGEINDFDISTSSQLTPGDVPVLVIRYDVNPAMEFRDY